MIGINAYLNFPGTCEEVMNFYAETLGGTILMMSRHAGSPMDAQVAAEWKNKIIHARMKLGDTLLMASDSPSNHYKPVQGASVIVNVDTPAEADRIFAALSQGAGSVGMAIQETFWARRFGMCTDRFGTPWMGQLRKKPM